MPSMPSMHPVTSSAIAAIGYDLGRTAAYVEFVGGALYAYADVTPRLWREFEAADSKGRFVNTVLKPLHPCRRIRGPRFAGQRPAADAQRAPADPAARRPIVRASSTK